MIRLLGIIFALAVAAVAGSIVLTGFLQASHDLGSEVADLVSAAGRDESSFHSVGDTM